MQTPPPAPIIDTLKRRKQLARQSQSSDAQSSGRAMQPKKRARHRSEHFLLMLIPAAFFAPVIVFVFALSISISQITDPVDNAPNPAIANAVSTVKAHDGRGIWALEKSGDISYVPGNGVYGNVAPLTKEEMSQLTKNWTLPIKINANVGLNAPANNKENTP